MLPPEMAYGNLGILLKFRSWTPEWQHSGRKKDMQLSSASQFSVQQALVRTHDATNMLVSLQTSRRLSEAMPYFEALTLPSQSNHPYSS